MNIHLAQSIQARNELERIANVKYQIIGAKDSNPIIGCVQDAISGAYMMSNDDKIDYSMAANLLCNTSSTTKNKLKKGEVITGRQTFSHIIPEGINSVKTKGKDIIFQIKNGELLKGVLDKNSLSTKKNSIIHYVWDKYGPTHTQKFIDDTQRLVLNYLLNKGLTVGLKDCIIADDLIKQVREIVHTKIIATNHALTQYENDYDKITPDVGDSLLMMDLNTVGSNIGKMIMDVLDKNNGFSIMVNSGAKGSGLNIQQIAGCYGQMSIEGQRIKKRITGRTLPIFHQNDDTASARGFIKSSFLDGMSGHEFFFHTMGGREGLIDTAIKSVTWDTPIIILENDMIKRINIGEWIDNYLDNNKDKVKNYDDRNLELLKLEKLNIKSYIPTTDADGNINWGEITAITRHDPGDTLYEIITQGGRKVIVTESKSLLIWNKDINKFVHTDTPNVKIGDYVPVTMNLGTPPIIKTYVEVSKYLPKTEYIYGTDFNKACEMLEEELSDRKKVSAGWWENHNGSSFTLPYPQSLKLRRTIERSNIEHIKDNCIYPYSAFRQDIQFEDKFKLDKENGQFIGLFLAEGNVDIKSGYVGITNNDMNIINFAKDWFDKRSIKTKIESHTNQIGGKSTTIRGYSTILAKFLTLFVGHGARHKYIPHEAYTAPEDFIIGLIDGYISGDGCITENSIQVGSASYELSEGISNLLNRLGIFAKMNTTHMKENNLGTIDMAPINMISIRAQWAKLFAEKITLMDIKKQDKLNNMKASLSHRNYEPINDVVLDAIVKINIINKDVVMEKYPKVYDLTVPSTLNFGLANGLHVVDTAETGYIQRQCIKFLEDLLVNYEGLVRTANGVLVQYLYGDSGIDPQKQTQVKLNIINMNNDVIKEQFTFTDDEAKKLEKKFNINKKAVEDYNNKIHEKMIEMRDTLRTIYFKSTGNYKVIEDSFMLPINMLRVSQEIQSDEEFAVSPIYILEKLEDLLTNYDDRFITMMKEDSSLLKKDDQSYKFMLRLALYEYFSPRKCLVDYKISKEKFDELIEDIRVSLSRSLVEPGEMVGVVAAQSVGEPCSQMSANFDTKITCILVNKLKGTVKAKTIKIGELCDKIIEENPHVTYNTGHTDSVETEMNYLDYDYYIIGVDNKEQTHWNKISHISRHPVNGDLMKVTTKSGRTVTTTLSHSHLIRRNQTVEPITGADLKVGMRIPVTKHIDNTFINLSSGLDDYSLGCDLGNSLKQTDNIPEYVFTTSNDFKKGFIQTYFDNNAEFNNNGIHLNSNNNELIKELSLLLNYFDVFTLITDNNYKLSIYNCEQYKKEINSLKHNIVNNNYNDIDKINGLEEIIKKCNKLLNIDIEELHLYNIERTTLFKYIDTFEAHKNVKLISEELSILKQAANSNVIWDEIVDINIYTPDQKDYVYDFTVPGNQTFMVDTGIIVHNTLNTKHFAGVASKGSANSGVGRIKEIIRYSKQIKTPQMIIYFDDKYCTSKSDTNLISSYFKHLTIRELISSAEIYYENKTSSKTDELSKLLEQDTTSNPFYINNAKDNIKSLPFVIRLTMNLEKMMEKETTLLDIKTKFITYWYKNFSNLKTVKKSHKDILVNIDKLAILSNTDNMIHIRFKMNEFNYTILTSFLNIILDVITLKGIDNIENVTQNHERRIIFNEKGDTLVEKEHMVITDGINLNGIKMLKGINFGRSRINDIQTVYVNYGIEAARGIIINELLNTFEAGGAGSINHAHISLLVDTMTYSGEVISVDRHGMNKVDNDPISKASFEKTMDHFINAAIFSESDKMQSVSSRVALGRVIPGGTGAFDLLLDTQKLKNSEYIQDETGGRTNFIALKIDPLFEDVIKNGFARNDFYVPK